MLARDKRSSFLRKFVNYGRKNFHNFALKTALAGLDASILVAAVDYSTNCSTG
jgi:hypothetical protein